MQPFVTLSASYGSAGSEIGPALAAELGVPFFDRAIPVEVAGRLGTSADDPMLQEERPSGFFERLLSGFSSIGPLYGAADLPLPFPDLVTEEDYRAEVDRVIRAAGEGAAGGVLLGRAGAVVLAGHPRATHVRLDASFERRIGRVCEETGVDRDQAARQLRQNDAAREAYVKQLYGVDATDPTLYDLIIDSTSIPIPACVDLIALAVTARQRHAADPA